MAGTYVQFPASDDGSVTGSVTGVPYSVGVIDSAAANVNGGVIGSFSLFFQSASATNPGLVSSAAQAFAGVKTFNSSPILNSLTASLPVRLDGSKAFINGSISLTSEVSGNLPLSQTAGSISLTNQVSGNLPLSQTSGSLSLTAQVSGILPIVNGGTNSGSALSGNRVIVSSAGALVEFSALTGSAPLRTDAGGMLTVGSVSLSSDVSGNLSLSRISAALTENSIDNASFIQEWNWNSLSSQTGMRLASSFVTSGSVLSVSNTYNHASSTGNALSVVVSGANNLASGINIQHAPTGAATEALNINVSGNSQAHALLINHATQGAGTAASINVNNSSNTGTVLNVRNASTADGVGINVNMDGTSGNQDAIRITMEANGGTGNGVEVTMNGGTAGGACLTGYIQSQNAWVLDAEVDNLGGVQKCVRLKNTENASVGNAAQLVWAANRTGGTLTNVSGIAGTITDITAGAYKGDLKFYTADNATPVARMALDYTGKLSLTGSGSFEAAKMTIGSVSVVSSTGGAAYTISLPGAQGALNDTLINDGSGNLAWGPTSGMTNPMTTLGDMIVGSTSGAAGRLAVGSTGYMLSANPLSPTAVAWENDTSPDYLKNVGLGVEIASGTLRIALVGQNGQGLSTTNPAIVSFRDISGGLPTTNARRVVGSTYMTISAGSNLGLVGSTTARIWVYAYDNVGAVGLAASTVRQDESNICSFSVESAVATYGSGSSIWSTVSGGMVNNMAVSLTTTGQLPASYSTNTVYWTVTTGTTSFQLSASPNGSVIVSTGSGSAGVHTFHAQHTGLVTSSSTATGLPVRLLGSIVVAPSLMVNGSFSTYSLLSVGPAQQPQDDISMRYVNCATGITNTDQTLFFPQRGYDTHNCYNRFGVYVVPATGKYQVNAKYRVNGTFSLNAVARISTVNNGATLSQNFFQTGAAQGSADVWLSDILYLNAFDIFQIQGSTDATTPSIGSSSTFSYVSVARV